MTRSALTLVVATTLLGLWLLTSHRVGAEESAPPKQAAGEVSAAIAVRDYVALLTEAAKRLEGTTKSESEAIQRESGAIQQAVALFLYIVGVVGTLVVAGQVRLSGHSRHLT